MNRILLAVGAIAAIAGAAFHTALKSSIPAKGAAVTAPAKVSLTFTEAVTLPVSKISVLKPDSTELEALVVKGTSDPATIEGAVTKPMAPGKYLIRWRTAADDGHAATGVFGFTVVAR